MEETKGLSKNIRLNKIRYKERKNRISYRLAGQIIVYSLSAARFFYFLTNFAQSRSNLFGLLLLGKSGRYKMTRGRIHR
jgi:hypothetical protein